MNCKPTCSGEELPLLYNPDPNLWTWIGLSPGLACVMSVSLQRSLPLPYHRRSTSLFKLNVTVLITFLVHVYLYFSLSCSLSLSLSLGLFQDQNSSEPRLQAAVSFSNVGTKKAVIVSVHPSCSYSYMKRIMYLSHVPVGWSVRL